MKKAVITGISGQDGAYLAAFLLKKKYCVIGIDRITTVKSLWRLEALGIKKSVKVFNVDLRDLKALEGFIRKYKPDEIYNFAAQSSVMVSFSEPLLTADINAFGPLKILETLKKYSPKTAFFQASTAEIFGDPQQNAAFSPKSPYGIAKLFAHQMVINYREVFGLRACSGILYNHESPLRDVYFITRKITNGAVRIKLGLQKKLVLGNIDARRDWGYAGDFVRGIWLMLQKKVPLEYVLATGETHSVREFVELAFLELGITIVWRGSGLKEKGCNKANGKILVEISKKYFRPVDIKTIKGDSRKTKKELGWKPETSFAQMIREMMAVELGKGGRVQ